MSSEDTNDVEFCENCEDFEQVTVEGVVEGEVIDFPAPSKDESIGYVIGGVIAGGIVSAALVAIGRYISRRKLTDETKAEAEKIERHN
jgi:hypothetical protein